MSTPDDLNMLSISNHIPGIGFRYTSRFVAAKMRNGMSCSWRQINALVDDAQLKSWYTYRPCDEPDLLLPFCLVRLDSLRIGRVTFWCKLVREEYDRVPAHPVHTQGFVSLLFAVARYVPQRLTHPHAAHATCWEHKRRKTSSPRTLRRTCARTWAQ